MTPASVKVGDPKVAAQTRACRIPEQHVAKVGELISYTAVTTASSFATFCCPQVWNMAYYSGLVCIAPYLNVYYRRSNISERQIGVLAALSPWVNASSGLVFNIILPVFGNKPSVKQRKSNAG